MSDSGVGVGSSEGSGASSAVGAGEDWTGTSGRSLTGSGPRAASISSKMLPTIFSCSSVVKPVGSVAVVGMSAGTIAPEETGGIADAGLINDERIELSRRGSDIQ